MLPDERECRSVTAPVLALSVFCAFRARFRPKTRERERENRKAGKREDFLGVERKRCSGGERQRETEDAVAIGD